VAGKPGLLQIIRDSLWNPNYDTRSVITDPFLNGQFFDFQDNVSIDEATKLATVFSSVNLLSQDVSRVPFNIHERGQQDKVVQFDDPVARLIRNPNPNMTKYPFWYSQVWMYLTQGNSYSWIRREQDGTPVELIPILPWNVQLKKSGERIFALISGIADVVPYEDIFHLKLYTFDGWNGVSPLAWNSQLMRQKIKENKFSQQALGEKPVGFLKGDVKDAQVQNVVDAWQLAQKEGKTPFLVGDVDYKALTITPNEAQYLETQTETKKDIYSIYRINPTLISNFDQGVQANAEEQSLNHTKYTLAPHYVMIEEEVNKKLLDPNFFSKHNINAFLLGDVKTRKELMQFYRVSGILTGNEIRALENFGPSPDEDMDKIFIQGAMTPLDKAGQEKVKEVPDV